MRCGPALRCGGCVLSYRRCARVDRRWASTQEATTARSARRRAVDANSDISFARAHEFSFDLSSSKLVVLCRRCPRSRLSVHDGTGNRRERVPRSIMGIRFACGQSPSDLSARRNNAGAVGHSVGAKVAVGSNYAKVWLSRHGMQRLSPLHRPQHSKFSRNGERLPDALSLSMTDTFAR
jgi:hypothetical protein